MGLGISIKAGSREVQGKTTGVVHVSSPKSPFSIYFPYLVEILRGKEPGFWQRKLKATV